MSDYTYPRQLIPVLLKRLTDLPPPTRDPTPGIDQEALGTFLDVVFHASLQQEEGRPLRFQIAFLTDKDLEFLKESKLALRFHEIGPPPRLSVGALVKLAPIAQPAATMLCVHDNAILGFIATGGSWRAFLERSQSNQPQATAKQGQLTILHGHMPPLLTITVAGPGYLQLSLGAFSLLTLEGGRIRDLAAVFEMGPVAEYFEPEASNLRQRVPTLGIPQSLIPDATASVRDCICRMLVLIRRARHGGTLLFDRCEDLQSFANVKNRNACSIGLLSCLAYVEQVNATSYAEIQSAQSQAFPLLTTFLNQLTLAHALMEDYLAAVAALSQIDGAVLVGRELTIKGFGAMVEHHEGEKPEVLRCLDAQGSKTVPHELRESGARHGSAIAFCESSPERLALLVSQDGGVRAIRSVDGRVLYWPDIAITRFGL